MEGPRPSQDNINEAKTLNAKDISYHCSEVTHSWCLLHWFIRDVLEIGGERTVTFDSEYLDIGTKQVDYTAAFVHADIDKPPNYSQMTPDEQSRVGAFVEMPGGFAKPGHVCKLNKSPHGLEQAPRIWFHHLRDNLLQVGFTQMIDVDPCLFISAKVICVTSSLRGSWLHIRCFCH